MFESAGEFVKPGEIGRKSTPPPPKVGFRKPATLDPAAVYGSIGKNEKPAPPKPTVPKPSAPSFRAPKVKPVPLNSAAVYPGPSISPKAAKKSEAPKVTPPAAKAKIPPVKPQFAQSGNKPEAAPKAARPELPKTEVAESAHSDIEVLGPETKNDSRSTQLSTQQTNQTTVSKWAFWRRPSKRDQQLARISEGYVEMVDLVRAMRNQLESQNENNIILRESLAHLPKAVEGLQNFSKSQESVGQALEKVHGQMVRYTEKDEKLADSMNGFNNTLKGMDDTSKASIKTFDRVQERMRDSDIRMENLFQNVQASEEKVSDTMVRLQRNMAIMQIFFLVCLLGAIGALIFTLMKKAADEEKVAPKPKQEEVSVTRPATPATGDANETPVRAPRTIGE